MSKTELQEPHQSLTLSQLSAESIPSTACRRCRAAVWHQTRSELRCFCRVMRVHSYTPTTQELLICDGMELAEDL